MKSANSKQYAQTLLDNITIILVRPRVAENIGAAARITFNMGISRMVVISDTTFAREPMAKMATHKAAHIIDRLTIYSSLPKALEKQTFVVGTTARRGRQRFVQQSPREAVDRLLPLLPNNRVAILFGSEDRGLTNQELKHCQLASAIPTADFCSLNLAQAIAIYCYELFHGIIHAPKDLIPSPALATSFELESMYGHLEKSLLAIDFMEECSRDHWMANIRHLFNRIELTSKDANIIRGICKKFLNHQQSILH
jgi:tRNA/rRNA methyltransferase